MKLFTKFDVYIDSLTRGVATGVHRYIGVRTIAPPPDMCRQDTCPLVQWPSRTIVPLEAAGICQVFNVFRGALAPAPWASIPNNHGAIYPSFFTRTPSPTPLFPHPSHFPPLSQPSPLPCYLLLDEATPFNQLENLGERCQLPSGVWAHRHRFWCILGGKTHLTLTAITTWIFVYRKVYTCVLHKIHIDNIAVVLPLVT